LKLAGFFRAVDRYVPAAKSIKTEKDLGNFTQMLAKVIDEHLGYGKYDDSETENSALMRKNVRL